MSMLAPTSFRPLQRLVPSWLFPGSRTASRISVSQKSIFESGPTKNRDSPSTVGKGQTLHSGLQLIVLILISYIISAGSRRQRNKSSNALQKTLATLQLRAHTNSSTEFGPSYIFTELGPSFIETVPTNSPGAAQGGVFPMQEQLKHHSNTSAQHRCPGETFSGRNIEQQDRTSCA